MKNFTNKFKQLTSRLSARWLIMALMMLVGTSSVWAVDVYFKNTLGWSNVYAYVRTSGSMWNGNNGVTTNNATRYDMSNIGDNVWKCTTSSTFAEIVFIKDKQDNYGNIWRTEASYNPSYTTSKPMFTPTTTLTETRNETKYYNSGTWSSYTPPCKTVTITWDDFTDNMCLGDQQTLTATASSGATVTFSSSDATYASISGTKLTAVKAGSATITASVAASGNYCSASEKKTVNIIDCIPVGTVLYLKPNSNWTTANARFALHLFTEGGEAIWVDATSVCNNDGYYEATVPEGIWAELIWCRMNPSTTENKWDNKWDQTGDLTYNSTKNLFTIPSGAWSGSTTTWSAWTPEPCCTTLDKPSLTKTNIELCNGDPQNYGTIKISNYNSSYSYTLNNNAVTPFKVGDTWYIADDIEVAGDYTVTVDVSGSCESKTATINIPAPTDNTPAIGEFSVSSSSQISCSGTQVTLEATNVNGASYQWFLNGSQEPISGATSRIYEPTITANAIYKVVVSKTSNSCTATKNASVSVTAIPVASTNNFDITIPENAVYNGQKHSATATVKSGITGMGAVTVKHYKNGSEVDPIDAGDYVVKMSVAAGDSYCAMSETQIGTFTIAPAEQTDFSITNSSYEICGKSVTVTATGGQSDGAITYSITTDNTSTKDASIDDNTGVLTVKSAGTVSVQAKRAATTNYKEITDNVTFTFTMPIENVKLAVKNTSIKASYCKDENITLVLTYDGPTPDFNNNEFEWVLSGIQTGTEFIGLGTNGINSGSEFTLQLGGVGVNKVGVKLKGCNGWVTSTDENSVNVTVNAIPTAPFGGVAQSKTICAGNYIFSSDYIWYTSTDGNGTVSGSTNLSETTTYYISQKVNNCESARTAYTVNVDQPLVVPTLTTTNPTTCNDNPTAGSIVIENYANYSNEISFALYKDENPTSITYNNGFAISGGGDYKVVMTTSASNVCGQSVETEPIKVTVQDNTPTITNATITAGKDAVCVNTGTTLTASATTDKGTLSYLWNTDATTESIETGNLTENTTYTVTITATNAGCAVSIPTVLSKTINVNPISAPSITAQAYSGVNAIDLTINVQDAGCAENYTLGYRIKQSDDLEYSENQVVKASTTETQASTTIEGLITGVEYVIQAYIINGYNNNEVFYTDPITCTVLASENCDVPSANYIEILANNDENLQLYAWVEGKGTTPLGGWSGKTRDTWYEVNSKGYSVWKIESSDPVYLIFNKGDNSKTDDIKGTDNEGFKPGYRYIFDVNLSTWNYTLQSQTLIADPEVETVSATPVRIDETKSNVTLVGRIIKRGCADIRSYGFQYKLIDAKDYSNLEVGTDDIEPGSTFTGSLELGVGTYYLRARVENENGSKAYGKEIRVTIAERDLNIAAVHNDTDVDTDTYYDFVGLYMSSITKPTTVDIVSYTWYKDGDVYNPTFTESDLYGDTYINSNGTNNIRPNQTGVYKLKVTLSNSNELESNEITIDKASAVSASSILNASNRTLPVISVRTNEDFPTCSGSTYPSAQADKLKKKRSVDVKIFDKDGKLYYDRKARMNYRGSSSLNFVKKSYAFCPGDEMCGDAEKGLDYVITKKVNMFNLGAEDKDWVLYAAAADPSMMRNRIVFDTYSKMTNKWGVKSMYVELIVDGEYKGVYVFMDKITKNKDRVNITAVDGFIVKFDKTDTADRYVDGKQEEGDEKTFMTERTGRQGISTYGTTVDQMFEIEYPEKDDNKGTWNNIVASIKEKFEAFETALAEGKYAKVREIIDYDSWADWFIINEYIKNQDAYRASCIFVYNGEKIEARPLWDQELSMNNTCRTSNGSGNTSGLLIENDGVYSDCFPAPFWFTGKNAQFGSCGGNNGSSTLGTAYSNYLLKDGCFIGLVQQKLADYLKEGAALYAGTDENNGPLLKLATTFNKELTSKTEGQTSAQEREASFWTGKTRATADCSGDTGYTDKSYSTEYNNLYGWIKGDRDENLTSILGGMSGEMSAGISITTSPANAVVTPWIPITVTVNVSDNAEYIYDDSAITEGIIVDVDKAITSKSGNVYKYTFPRPSDWGTDNVDTPIQQIVYPINAKLKVYDTVCPGLSNEAGVYIKLKDEGNDICGELVGQ